MSKKVEFTLDGEEIEIAGSCQQGTKGRRASKFDALEPDEPPCVEDLYVGLIIGGTAIDITDRLNQKQRDYFEQKCFDEASDDQE
jgi:hypothetical protein